MEESSTENKATPSQQSTASTPSVPSEERMLAVAKSVEKVSFPRASTLMRIKTVLCSNGRSW